MGGSEQSADWTGQDPSHHHALPVNRYSAGIIAQPKEETEVTDIKTVRVSPPSRLYNKQGIRATVQDEGTSRNTGSGSGYFINTHR